MKNIFIKLHLQDNDSSIYVNINHIVSLYELPNCTSVGTTNTPYRVREHKDEIIKMINKIQKVWI